MKYLFLSGLLFCLALPISSRELPGERILAIDSEDLVTTDKFGFIQDIETDSTGNIYLCDSRGKKVFGFDAEGEHQLSIPDTDVNFTFQGPTRIELDDSGNIYVIDYLARMVFQFDKRGELQQSVSYAPRLANEIAVTSEKKILISHWASRDKASPFPLVSEYNLNGELLKEYGKRIKFPEKVAMQYGSNHICLLPDDILIVSFSYPHIFKLFQGGALTNTIEKHDPRIEEYYLFERYDNQRKKQRAYVWKVLPFSEDKFVAVIRDEGENYRENMVVTNFDILLDIFTVNGQHLKRFSWDWKNKGLPRHIDGNGYFFTNFSEKPSVQGVSKWKVEWGVK